MLKLMKYEFRKTRTVLVVLLIAFAALQLGFVAGIRADRPRLYIPASMLTAFLVYGAYVYILLSGIVSYSRELRDRTGYLVFLVPVHPIGVVLSKLLFTLLAAVAATAVFGAGAYLDYVGGCPSILRCCRRSTSPCSCPWWAKACRWARSP